MHAFLSLIDELNQASGESYTALEARVFEEFQVERTVFVLDMSGFSLQVRRGGILSHLCKIRRIQILAREFIHSVGGELITEVADNVMACFLDCTSAVRAAVGLQRRIRALQQELGSDTILSAAIGLDHGKFLLIPRKDAFGDPVNIAFKLGEDVARADEILITDNVRSQLAPESAADYHLQEMQLSISGVDIHAHRVVYE